MFTADKHHLQKVAGYKIPPTETNSLPMYMGQTHEEGNLEHSTFHNNLKYIL